MNNKTTNNHNNNNISNNNNNFNISSQQSTPTRSTRHQEEREIEQRRQRHHILLMKSNKMLKRCCCYMLILSLGVLMSPLLPPKVEATAVAFVGEALAVVTTDAPPPKRLGAAATAASVEMLQLPHAFRHEEHYSHRIEQAVNDFKRAQMQKLKERDKNEEKDKNQTTKAPPAPLARPTLNNNNDNSNNNNKNRNDLFQWQMEPHHRRHEQHYLQNNNNQPQQQLHSHQQNQKQHQQQEQQQQHSLEHHLRHSNGRFKHLEENIIALPPMRHQRHQMQQQQHNKQHKNQPFNNFDSFNFDSNIQPNSNQRLSFQLKTDHFEQNFDDESSSISDDETDAAVNNKNDSANSSDESSSSDDDDSDDDEEYSYEDDSDESTFGNSFRRRSSNSYSAIDGKAASVKRYTNPFKNFRTSAVSSSKKRWNLLDEQRESNKNKLKKIDDDSNSNTNGSSNDSNDDEDQVNDGHGNDEDSNNFTNEKWHKIESEHHRRQLQHQREMQALRLRHSPNGLKNQQKIHNERHFKNEDPLETDSIFSRNYIPGTLTRHKIQELGTAEAVLETRRTHATKHKKNRELANAHVKQIISEAACRIPQRRVERIQLDPAKTYTPHCTILHRCADDTGCCRSERQTCAPKVTQNVDLYFFVKDMKEKRPTIERLTFINHTECHCVDRAQRLPDEYHNSVGSFSAAGHELTLRRATILNCNCPKLFEKILQEDGYCRCDCSSGNTGCDWLKRGMEHFSMIDRKCMLEGRCKPPTCEYGTYLKKHGRCPRREEQLAYTLSGNNGGISASYSSNFSPSYSSAAAAGTSLSALTTNSLH